MYNKFKVIYTCVLVDVSVIKWTRDSKMTEQINKIMLLLEVIIFSAQCSLQ